MPVVTLLKQLVLAAILILGCLPCFASIDAGERIILQDGYAFVDVIINGHGPFRMLIDTGALSCMLTPEAAQLAGLSLDHRIVLASLAGEKVVPGASNNQVQVGTSIESNVAILVSELPKSKKQLAKADGVLGQNFLGRSAYLIDYKLKRLWLSDQATEQAERLPIIVTGAKSHGRTILSVVLERGGAPWRLTLDSGTNYLVIACGERCPKASDMKPDNRISSYAGDRSVSLGTLRHVEVGGVKMSPKDAVLVESSSLDGTDGGVLPASWFSAVFADGDVVRLRAAR